MIILTLISSLIINLGLFLVAFRNKSDKLTDLSYALTFISLALICLFFTHSLTPVLIIPCMMVIAWALRIGGFLFIRIIKTGVDHRFDNMRDSFVKFGKFWLGQGISVWVLMLPVILLAGHENPHVSPLLACIGVAIWLIGLVIESIADYQKRQFASNPKNANHWIESGIWKYSRHPNYFGEMLIWIGIYVYVCTSLAGVEKLIGLASPLVIIILLRFISGVPILESSADTRWGKQPAYHAYKARTRLLLPLPRR